MKVAVIGGAGVRTPLLVSGLTGSDLPIDEIALYDIDQDRLSTIGGVAARMAAQGRVSSARRRRLRDGRRPSSSIRVGGLAHRVRDETIALSHGIVGQETIGPAGFAMAARTIPHMVEYAQAISRAAPGAWIINFTNPVGMITEAMRTVTSRVIGICDTPTELFGRGVARARFAKRPFVLRLLRPESSWLDPGGLQRWRAAAAPALERPRAAAVALQGAALRSGVLAPSRAPADRVRLLLRVAHAGRRQHAAGGTDARPGDRRAHRRAVRRVAQLERRQCRDLQVLPLLA